MSYERGCQGKKSPLLPCAGKLFALHPARCRRSLRGCRRTMLILEHDQAWCRLCLHFVSCCDGGSTPSVCEAAQAEVLASEKVPTMILFETRGQIGRAHV